MKRYKKDSNNLFKFFILFIILCIITIFIISISKLIFNKFIPSRVDIIEVVPKADLIKPGDLEFLKDKNIFDIDLKEASLVLSRKYPGFAAIKLYKRFPDKIIVHIVRREGFAQLKSGINYYIIDRDFMVVSKEANLSSNLIEVKGIENFSKSKYKKLVTSIIDFFNKNTQYPKIICLDVSNLPNIKLVLYNYVNIIISVNNFNEKIKLLLYLMSRIKKDAANIDYVDLRFKEPVINYR
ncbi:MAG: hypothetical protein AB1755_01870 [Candidatus Omnitrophota bacterium]